jgi:hypothetical protein
MVPFVAVEVLSAKGFGRVRMRCVPITRVIATGFERGRWQLLGDTYILCLPH